MYLLPLFTVASKFKTQQQILKVDSGATKTYLQLKHAKFLQNVELLRNGPYATLPDSSKIQATVRDTLPLHPNLAPTALDYPSLNKKSLLSIVQLCDNGCITVFDKSKLSILKNGKIVLSRHRNLTNRLWDVLFRQKVTHIINYIILSDKNKTKLAQYLHGFAFSPVISTFQKCLQKENFISWPGITDLNFKKLIETTEATFKVHLDQEREICSLLNNMH